MCFLDRPNAQRKHDAHGVEQESVHRIGPAPTPQKADPDYIV